MRIGAVSGFFIQHVVDHRLLCVEGWLDIVLKSTASASVRHVLLDLLLLLLHFESLVIDAS